MYQILPKNNFNAVGDFQSTDGMSVREKVDHTLKIIEDLLTEIKEKFGYRLLSEEGLKRYSEVDRYWEDQLPNGSFHSFKSDDEKAEWFLRRSKDLGKVFDEDPIHQKWNPIKDDLELSYIFWESFKEGRRYKYDIERVRDLNGSTTSSDFHYHFRCTVGLSEGMNDQPSFGHP